MSGVCQTTRARVMQQGREREQESKRAREETKDFHSPFYIHLFTNYFDYEHTAERCFATDRQTQANTDNACSAGRADITTSPHSDPFTATPANSILTLTTFTGQLLRCAKQQGQPDLPSSRQSTSKFGIRLKGFDFSTDLGTCSLVKGVSNGLPPMIMRTYSQHRARISWLYICRPTTPAGSIKLVHIRKIIPTSYSRS